MRQIFCVHCGTLLIEDDQPIRQCPFCGEEPEITTAEVVASPPATGQAAARFHRRPPPRPAQKPKNTAVIVVACFLASLVVFSWMFIAAVASRNSPRAAQPAKAEQPARKDSPTRTPRNEESDVRVFSQLLAQQLMHENIRHTAEFPYGSQQAQRGVGPDGRPIWIVEGKVQVKNVFNASIQHTYKFMLEVSHGEDGEPEFDVVAAELNGKPLPLE